MTLHQTDFPGLEDLQEAEHAAELQAVSDSAVMDCIRIALAGAGPRALCSLIEDPDTHRAAMALTEETDA